MNRLIDLGVAGFRIDAVSTGDELLDKQKNLVDHHAKLRKWCQHGALQKIPSFSLRILNTIASCGLLS